ncbi:hypothetical protein JCM18899A_54580 [Nocardioides sp. AN3]
MDPCRIHREVVEQGPPGLELVAVGVVDRDEPVITPVEVHPGPIHQPAGLMIAHALHDCRAGAATGEHDGRDPRRDCASACPEDLGRSLAADGRHFVGGVHLGIG